LNRPIALRPRRSWWETVSTTTSCPRVARDVDGLFHAPLRKRGRYRRGASPTLFREPAAGLHRRDRTFRRRVSRRRGHLRGRPGEGNPSLAGLFSKLGAEGKIPRPCGRSSDRRRRPPDNGSFPPRTRGAGRDREGMTAERKSKEKTIVKGAPPWLAQATDRPRPLCRRLLQHLEAQDAQTYLEQQIISTQRITVVRASTAPDRTFAPRPPAEQNHDRGGGAAERPDRPGGRLPGAGEMISSRPRCTTPLRSGRNAPPPSTSSSPVAGARAA